MSGFQFCCHKMHASTRIHSQTHAANETLQEYIQGLTGLVIQATDPDPAAVTCQVMAFIFINKLSSKGMEQILFKLLDM